MHAWVASFISAFWFFHYVGATLVAWQGWLIDMDREIESLKDQSWIVWPGEVLIINLYSSESVLRAPTLTSERASWLQMIFFK